MAWPLVPLTTYSAGTTPAIKAADLNAIQDVIVQLFNGTVTVKTFYADGVGGNSLSQLPGLVVSSGSVTHTATPNTVNYLPGTVGKGTVARAWAVCLGDSTFQRGYKVYSTARTAMQPTGDYTITFDTNPADTTNACPWVTIIDNGTPAVAGVVPSVSGGKQVIRVLIRDLAGTLTDRKFAVGFYGE